MYLLISIIIIIVIVSKTLGTASLGELYERGRD
jgi:hypothetical protein